MIKESEILLEWTAEHVAEIIAELIDTALTSYEANDTVANSRRNPLEVWRRLQKRNDPTTGGRKRNLLRTIVSPARRSL